MDKNTLHYKTFCEKTKNFWNKTKWDLTRPPNNYEKTGNFWNEERKKWFEKVQNQRTKVYNILDWLINEKVDLSVLYAKTKEAKKYTTFKNEDIYRNLILLHFFIKTNILKLHNKNADDTIPLIEWLAIQFSDNDYSMGITWFCKRLASSNFQELKQAFKQKKYIKIFQMKSNINFMRKIKVFNQTHHIK